MPELPEVTALASFLTDHAAWQPVVGVAVTSLNVLTTYDPPASALVGRILEGATRHGKFLDLVTIPADAPPDGDRLHLVLHLAAPVGSAGRTTSRRPRPRWAAPSRCGSDSPLAVST